MKTMKYTMLAVLLVMGLSASAGEKKVDVEKSVVTWEGKKVTGKHNGTIKVKSGVLKMKDGSIKGGEFVIDMTTLENSDMSGEMKGKLEGHLKSDDFFGVANNPTAKLVITEASAFKDGIASVTGDLTIKGKTNPVNFKVNNKNGMYHAIITVDRTLYNVRYGSGKFFDNLGDKTIYDDFTLEVKLVIN